MSSDAYQPYDLGQIIKATGRLCLFIFEMGASKTYLQAYWGD